MISMLNSLTLFNISALNWSISVIAALISYWFMRATLKFAINKLNIYAKIKPFNAMIAAVLSETRWFVIALVAILIGAIFIDLPALWVNRIDHLRFFVMSFQIGLWLNRAATLWGKERLKKDENQNPVITSMLGWILKFLVWSTILLAILANSGVNITAFVASLGVGGVAVALAVQSILSDLFASLAIGLDKPFEIGDFIAFGETSGNIEHIGLKTTRIRSISGEQIIISNTEMLKNKIHNYKRMEERRVAFNISVNYGLNAKQLAEISVEVGNVIKTIPKVRFDRAHFKDFGEHGPLFEIIYFVTDPDYTLYMDVQQTINLGLVEKFEALNIEFAIPIRRAL